MHVEGTVLLVSGNCPNLTFVVRATTVVGSASTRYDKKCDDLRIGRQVEVDGVTQANGSVRATRVEIKKDDKDDDDDEQ